MNDTKDDVKAKILAALQETDGKMNPSTILSKLGWKKDKTTEICKLFGTEKFTEVLQQFSEVKIEKDNNGTTYVVFAQNKKAQENKNMPETEKTSENVHDRMEQLLAALNDGMYEKEEAVRLSLLTAVAGESMFLLGAPGCAKSMIARRIAKAFKTDGDNPVRYFEYLMNQFSSPEEIFGNISIKALCGECEDENGKGDEIAENTPGGKEEYRRLTEGFLPTADIAFLDEIWKANPPILNSLLTIINERKFHNGSKVDDVPLKALFSASNELPAKDQGLEALYDRFILRLCVDFIQDENGFFEMLEQPSSSEFEISDDQKQILISNDELKAWKTKIDGVSLSENAKSVISAIRKELTARNEKLGEAEKSSGETFEVGDRRWKKIARILKTSAFLNDRAEVDLMDCSLIEHCIWSTEAQQKKAREIVSKCIEENGLDCDTAIEDIEDQIEEFAANVEQTWFEEIQKDKTVTVDKQKCYECTRQGTNETWYITVSGGTHYSNSYHDIYDSAKNYRNYASFNKDGDIISCWQIFTVKKVTVLQTRTFSAIAHETMQKNFDKAYYAPIVDKINAEIDSLKRKKDEDTVPFKANLFADQDYNKNIMAKLEDAKQQLEDAKVNLDKQRNRYFNAEISAAFSVGDVILKNGITYSAKEIKNLSEEEKKNVVAVVCMVGNKTYAIGIAEAKMKWDALQEFCAHYGDNLPKDCASNWIVPDKEQLDAIWKNREAINESLSAIQEDYALTAPEYWSSSSDGTAAFFQLFGEQGHQDHTTKDHEYAVRAIREWKK